MNYAYQTQAAITKLLEFKIEYSTVYKSYILNGKWTDEYHESLYHEEIEEIKNLLHLTLKNALNHEEYLQDLLDQMWKRVQWLMDNEHNSPNFIDFYSEKILQNELSNKKLSADKLTYEKFKKGESEVSEENLDLFNYLSFNSGILNQYKSSVDFEKGLLLNAIDVYKQAINDLYDYIYSIHMNAEYTDFKNFEFEDLKPVNTLNEKVKTCNFNLEKKSIAYLFRILIEENIIIFNESDIFKNELEMKKFVQYHFTYLDDQKKHVPIKNLNREYSEMKSRHPEHVEKQIKINDNLLNILNKRKNDLINIQNKNS